MPNLEDHCRHCLDLYGVEGREIHKWMDEPSRVYGGAHRVIRHDKETAQFIGERFGKYCGEGVKGQYLAQLCFYDHIVLDAKNSNEKTVDSHQFTQMQIEELQLEQPKYQREIVNIKKQIEELDSLPELSIREMTEYRDVKIGHKSLDSKLLAEISLRHWQKYLLTRDTPNRDIGEIDINGFVAQLRRSVKSPSTIANYLGQLVSYFRYAYGEKISELIKNEKDKADKEVSEIKRNALPLRIKDIKMFYQEAKPHVKLAVRLLLLEDLKVEDLLKITAMQEANGKYHFFNGDTRVKIDDETAKLAVSLLGRNKGKLIRGQGNSHRSLDNVFQDWSKKLHIQPNITPNKLQIFAKNLHPDDIREYVLDEKKSVQTQQCAVVNSG